MLDLNQLSQNPFFHQKKVQKDELVFDEGEIDTCLYIVWDGEICIEKYLSPERNEVKEIAVLHSTDIFWEWAFSASAPKEVRVRALEDSTLYFIDVAKDMELCLQQFPPLSLQILKEIISLTNKRLLVSNREATINYEITKLINGIEIIDMKNITSLFDQISRIFWSDYLLYLEKKEFIDHTLVIRYDTRNSGKYGDIVITFPDDFKRDVLEEYWINLWKNTLIQKISVGWIILWYIVFWNSLKEFSHSDKRNAQSIANNLVWILRQKKLLDEERDKVYLKTI